MQNLHKKQNKLSSKNIKISMKYDKSILSPKVGKKTKKLINIEYNCKNHEILA